MSLPNFLIKKTPKYQNIQKMRSILGDSSIHTVCEEALCPNIGECFSQKTATFIILGDTCTRACAFCGVKNGEPNAIDPDEPQKIFDAVKKLGLDYVVLTSVTRDDLSDFGAEQFAKVIEILKPLPVEVLIPDLCGDWDQLQKIINAKPVVINHNVETIPKLYDFVRPQANYRQSLELISQVKSRSSDIYTKSGFMVGLGEKDGEVKALLQDLKTAGCNIFLLQKNIQKFFATLNLIFF